VSAAVETGVVADFDERTGLGTVAAGSGRSYRFHCTAIADGSRRIEPGTPVVFVVVAARHGRWEAASLQELRGSPER
jgi:cold shock CspA family protein